MTSSEADRLVRVAAVRLGCELLADRPVREVARTAVAAVEADMERRRRSGELKSVYREYTEQRTLAEAPGERTPRRWRAADQL